MQGDTAAPSDIAPDVRIKYSDIVVEERIGSGAFAVVYRGTYRGRDVAVKELLAQPRRTGDAATDTAAAKTTADFLAEVALMAKLRHRNVVALVGACERPLALVTEYCARGNLYDILRSPVPLDVARRLAIAADAARGMAYLHSARPPIIHRDLKSQNIFIMDDWSAKIGDFGLSRFKASSAGALMTAQCGTFHWMAPELISSFSYTEKVDVYSFGIDLWELWTRSTPYAGMTAVQIAYAVVQGSMRPPIPHDCPPAYATLMSDCWATAPDDRPTFPDIVARLLAMTPALTAPPAAAAGGGGAGGGVGAKRVSTR